MTAAAAAVTVDVVVDDDNDDDSTAAAAAWMNWMEMCTYGWMAYVYGKKEKKTVCIVWLTAVERKKICAEKTL